jgi:hypothetical protein
MIMQRLGLGFVLVIAFGGVALAQGRTVFDGTYMGELTLTRIVKGDCTPPALGSLFPLRVEEGRVRFAYLPRFDTELVGRVRQDGAFVASAHIKRGREVVHMAGRIENGAVTARIKSPSCRYTFHSEE